MKGARRDADKRSKAIRRAQETSKLASMVAWSAPRGEQERLRTMTARAEAKGFRAAYQERGRRG